ncbi:MAG: hypothetical protein WCZ72_10165 [Gemmobacter sp.]
MPIAALSRWTMTFFAAALLLLLLAEALMALGWGYPHQGLRAPGTLIVVHLVAVGWLSLAMAGALMQFVPVLTTRPLAFERLALPALALLLCGLAGLVLGFGALAGWPLPSVALPLGGAALVAGFALVIAMTGRTLWLARPLALHARFVAAGLVALGAAVSAGLVFTGLLAGVPGLPLLLPEGTAFHALLGLGGWLSLIAFGVSYRLFAMFMLAPERPGRGGRAILGFGGAGLAAAAAGLVALGAGWPGSRTLLVLAVAGFVLAALAYLADIAGLFRSRMRRGLEINMRGSIAALSVLSASLPLALVALLPGSGDRWAAATLWLFGFGWLSLLTLAQLLKITAFLTWLQVYAPVMGRAPTPQVQELLLDRRAEGWLALFLSGAVLGTLAILFGAGLPVRFAALLMLAGTLGVVAELVRIRRLAGVAPARRLPPGTRRPPLFLPPAQIRSPLR